MVQKFGTVTPENYPQAISTVHTVQRCYARNARVCTAVHTVASIVFALLAILYCYGVLYSFGGDDDRALLAPLSFLLPLWEGWTGLFRTAEGSSLQQIILTAAAPFVLPFLAAVPAAIIAALIPSSIPAPASGEVNSMQVGQLKAALSDSRKLVSNHRKINTILRIVYLVAMAAMMVLMLLKYRGQEDFAMTAVGMAFCLVFLWFAMWLLQSIVSLPVCLLYKHRIYNGDLFGELDAFERKLKKEEAALAEAIKKEKAAQDLDAGINAFAEGDHANAKALLKHVKDHAHAKAALEIMEAFKISAPSMTARCKQLALLKETVLSDTDPRIVRYCQEKAAEMAPEIEEYIRPDYEEATTMLAEGNALSAAARLELASIADYKEGKLYYALAYLTGYNDPSSYHWIYDDLNYALKRGIADSAMEEIARSSLKLIEDCWKQKRQNARQQEAAIRAAVAAEVASRKVCNCVNYINGRCALLPMTLPLCWLDDRQDDWWMCKDYKPR